MCEFSNTLALNRKMPGPAEGPSPRPPPRSFLAETGRTAFHRTRCAQRRMTQDDWSALDLPLGMTSSGAEGLIPPLYGPPTAVMVTAAVSARPPGPVAITWKGPPVTAPAV